MKNIKITVFLPPFLILLLSAIYSFVSVEDFLNNASAINSWLLEHFGWLYSISTLAFLGICIWVYFSPIAKLKIGGQTAQPLLPKRKWFAITLCTTVAIGILFWGTAEPIYHLHSPPTGLNIAPNSPEALTFSLSTMFLHWTFTPYGIYTLAALMFALVYYNLKQPFSLASLLFPLFGKRVYGTFGNVIDAICLYSLVAGMAASLGAGILTIAGGLDTIFELEKTPFLLALIALAIVVTFIISAASGLQKGIQLLSGWNLWAFIALLIFVFIAGPTTFILNAGTEALGDYFYHFFERSLYTGATSSDKWAQNWTIFYWANWLAWTPVTALFLGRLGVGYSVREFIQMNLIFPSLFGCFWMMVFSGTALHIDFFTEGHPLQTLLADQDPEKAIFAVLETLPLAKLTAMAYLLISFLSYVTAADSNTSAMGGLSSKGISPESPEPSVLIKVIWGVTVGVIAWVMVAFAGIDGVKMASNLGGFPALFLVILVGIGMLRMPRLLQ